MVLSEAQNACKENMLGLFSVFYGRKCPVVEPGKSVFCGKTLFSDVMLVYPSHVTLPESCYSTRVMVVYPSHDDETPYKDFGKSRHLWLVELHKPHKGTVSKS